MRGCSKCRVGLSTWRFPRFGIACSMIQSSLLMSSRSLSLLAYCGSSTLIRNFQQQGTTSCLEPLDPDYVWGSTLFGAVEDLYPFLYRQFHR